MSYSSSNFHDVKKQFSLKIPFESCKVESKQSSKHDKKPIKVKSIKSVYNITTNEFFPIKKEKENESKKDKEKEKESNEFSNECNNEVQPITQGYYLHPVDYNLEIGFNKNYYFQSINFKTKTWCDSRLLKKLDVCSSILNGKYEVKLSKILNKSNIQLNQLKKSSSKKEENLEVDADGEESSDSLLISYFPNKENKKFKISSKLPVLINESSKFQFKANFNSNKSESSERISYGFY